MKRLTWVTLCCIVVVAAALSLPVSPVDKVYGQGGGIPPIPHAFYGSVSYAGGIPAPAGTVITAFVSGVQMGSIVATTPGSYGGAGAGQAKLIVQGMIADGATIEFFIAGNAADQTASFQSGGVTQLNLTTQAQAPAAPTPTPTPVPTTPPSGGSAPPPPASTPTATQPAPALTEQVNQMQPADAARTLEAASAQQAGAALAGLEATKAATIVQNMDPAKAAEAVATMSASAASSVLNSTSTSALVQIIPKMDEATLVRVLSNMSATKVQEVPAPTLLGAMTNTSPEKFLGGNTPQPAAGASSPATLSETDSAATYSGNTPDEDWGKLVGTPDPLKSILVKTRVALSNVRTMLDIYTSRPAAVSVDLPSGQVAKNYFQVRLDGLTPPDIIVGYISFKVDKTWMTQNSVQRWSVNLSRFDDTTATWLTLPTRVDSEDGSYVYYSAPVARFSYFAISGSQAVAPVQFKATKIDISPTSAEPGKTVTVTASVANVSTTDGTFAAALWLDKTADQVQSVAIKAGATAQVTFQTSARTSGSHEVRVDRQIGSFQVFPTVAEAFKSIAGKYSAVWGFDAPAQTWKVFDPSVPAFVNDLQYVEKARGYWMAVLDDSALIYGANIYLLKKGWNLIGWLG